MVERGNIEGMNARIRTGIGRGPILPLIRDHLHPSHRNSNAAGIESLTRFKWGYTMSMS